MVTLIDEHILGNFGGVSQNNFLNLLNNTEEEREDVTELNLSHYHLVDDLAQVLDNRLDQFTILSLNIQSINAKCNDLVILFESLRNIKFAAICLQDMAGSKCSFWTLTFNTLTWTISVNLK